jgi:hypothetical protein
MTEEYTMLVTDVSNERFSSADDFTIPDGVKIVSCPDEKNQIMINIMKDSPDVTVVSFENLKFGETKEIIENTKFEKYVPTFYNVYNYDNVYIDIYSDNISNTMHIQSPCTSNGYTDHLEEIYDKQPVDESELKSEVHRYISEVLDCLCMTKSGCARTYITDIVMIFLFDTPDRKVLYRNIYRVLSKKYNVTEKSIERTVRYNLTKSWESCGERIKHLLFPNIVGEVTKPTSAKFYTALADFVHNHYRESFEHFYSEKKPS